MADLPTEILVDHIFLKLPVTSLLRCNYVCKAWNRLLGDPEFIRMYLNHPHEKLFIATSSIKDSIISHCHFHSVDYEASEGTGREDAVLLNLNFPAEVHSTQILGSSNGLICVAVRYQIRIYRACRAEDILIWNPSTGDSKLIPAMNHTLHSSHNYNHALVGFSYDSSINEGKIVHIINSGFKIHTGQQTARVVIYSTKTNSWNSTIECNAPFKLREARAVARGHAVNGSIYWPLVYCQSDFQIVGFNLNDNKFRELQLPRDFEPCYHTYLNVLGGTLSIFQLSSAGRLAVWTMKEDEKQEWTKFMKINVSSLNYQVSGFIGPVCLMRNGKILTLFKEQLNSSSSYPDKKFVLYDPKRNKKEFFNIRWISRRYNFDVVTYIESHLFSPNIIAQ